MSDYLGQTLSRPEGYAPTPRRYGERSHAPRRRADFWFQRDNEDDFTCERESERHAISGVAETVEQKFYRLRDQWRAERGHSSSSADLILHPAYQKIISLGRPVVPLILRELAQRPDRWYWALFVITEQDPVPAKDRGNSKAMTAAWLNWGKQRRYRW